MTGAALRFTARGDARPGGAAAPPGFGRTPPAGKRLRPPTLGHKICLALEARNDVVQLRWLGRGGAPVQGCGSKRQILRIVSK